MNEFADFFVGEDESSLFPSERKRRGEGEKGWHGGETVPICMPIGVLQKMHPVHLHLRFFILCFSPK